MKEVEVKILEINRKEIEEKLINLGAKKIFDGDIHDFRLDNAQKQIRSCGQLLRIRTEGKKTLLTFKEKSGENTVLSTHELEVVVSDFDTIKELLSNLGFTAFASLKKHRTSYEHNGLHYEFDRYIEEHAFVPEYLEIEGHDTEEVFAAARTLGFSQDDCKPWVVPEVIDYYTKKKNKL